MTARPSSSSLLAQLVEAPEGPGRVALLGAVLVGCAGAAAEMSAAVSQLGSLFGERWPEVALRALRGVPSQERPRVLVALAPWLDASLAREALELVARFDAASDVVPAVRALAPRLGDAPVVALLRALRAVEDPPQQVELLCAVAAHAEGDARTAFLTAATRLAQRTASEPERIAAVVAVACLRGGEAAVEAWDLAARRARHEARLRLLAALVPVIPPDMMPELLARLTMPAHEIEAALHHAFVSLPLQALLDTLARIRWPHGDAIRDRLLARALGTRSGVALLDAVEVASRHFPDMRPAERDELLARAVSELDDAALTAAAPRLAGGDHARRDALLGQALAPLRGTALVAALERFRGCIPEFRPADALLVRAASTCTPSALERVAALAAGPGAAPLVVALRRHGTVSAELLRGGLLYLQQLPRKQAVALAEQLGSGRAFAELVEERPPADRPRAAAAMFDALVALRSSPASRAPLLARLLPLLPVERAREALVTGVRWGLGAAEVLDGLLRGRDVEAVADILAAACASSVRAVVDAVDRRLTDVEPAVARALTERLLRAEGKVVAARRRRDMLARRLARATTAGS